jgi:hypothetical protein
MDDQHTIHAPDDFRQRAAQIRRRWSPSERAERMGLPPDIPWRLQQHLVGPTENSWPILPTIQFNESRLADLLNDCWELDAGAPE